MTLLLEIVTVICTLIGGALLFLVLVGSEGAPQQAAGAGVAVAFGGLPYFIASVVHHAHARDLMKQQNRLLQEILDGKRAD